MFRSIVRLRAQASLVSKISTRGFAAQTPARSDLVQGLYLAALKSYVPPKGAAAEKVELVDKFSTPTAPAPPSLELAVASEESLESLEEEKWPALLDPIDDPHNFNPLWEIRTDVDDGKLLPKQLRKYDYHDH